MPNYYEELGLSQNATREEIMEACRKIILANNPSTNSSQEAKEMIEKFTPICRTLLNDELRSKYDKSINKTDIFSSNFIATKPDVINALSISENSTTDDNGSLTALLAGIKSAAPNSNSSLSALLTGPKSAPVPRKISLDSLGSSFPGLSAIPKPPLASSSALSNLANLKLPIPIPPKKLSSPNIPFEIEEFILDSYGSLKEKESQELLNFQSKTSHLVRDILLGNFMAKDLNLRRRVQSDFQELKEQNLDQNVITHAVSMRFKTVFDKICNFNPHDPDFGVNWPEEITELEDLLAEYEYIMLLNLGFDMVTAVRGNALKRASILSDYDHEIDKPEEIYVKINTYRGLLNKAK